MKVLYAIQGTGNGHLSRAKEIIPLLKKHCETDILVSGTEADISLPFEIKYRFNGFSFIFGNRGGVDILKTCLNSNIKKLIHEIRSVPVRDYDFVINDFEPVTAWACLVKKVPCISLSHQSAVLSKNSPVPEKFDPFGRLVLRYYAPTSVKFGFHFCRYSKRISTPVIRNEIRKALTTDLGYYTVYLPAFGNEELIEKLKQFPRVTWHVFSKKTYQGKTPQNIKFQKITNDGFISSLASCTGILCGAGFETPAEALHLGKKLLVIPMYNQYEQHCNAASLKELGVPVIKSINKRSFDKIRQWLDSDYKIHIDYPDNSQNVVNSIFEYYIEYIIRKNKWDKGYILSTPFKLS